MNDIHNRRLKITRGCELDAQLWQFALIADAHSGGIARQASAMSVQATGKLDPSVTRLSEIGTADLGFSMDPSDMIEDLMLAVAKRIEGVTARAGKKKTLDVRRIYKVEDTDRRVQKRVYKFGLQDKKRIGACFKSGDTFGVLGIVINARCTSGRGKGNRNPRTKKQLEAVRKLGRKRATGKQRVAAAKFAKSLGKRATTEKQRAAAEIVGKQDATVKQRSAAKIVGKQDATVKQRAAAAKFAKSLGKRAATEKQRAAAKIVGKQAATAKQRAAAAKFAERLGKRAATEKQRAAAKIVGKQDATMKQRAAAKISGQQAATVKQKSSAQEVGRQGSSKRQQAAVSEAN